MKALQKLNDKRKRNALAEKILLAMMKRRISYKSLQIYTKKERKSQYNKSKNKTMMQIKVVR